MSEASMTITITGEASATHPPGTIVNPDGSLTPPPEQTGAEHEGTDRA